MAMERVRVDAGNVAADHEDDSEFSDGVGEAERGGGEDGALREREKDFAQDAEAVGAEEMSLFEEGGIDGVESGSEGLDGEGEAVDDGADDESGEGEGEGMAEEVGGGSSEGGAGAEEDEEVEAEDGGREQDGEGGDGFDEGAEARGGGGDPAGDGDGEDEQDRGGDGGEAEGEGEGLEVHSASVRHGFEWIDDGADVFEPPVGEAVAYGGLRKEGEELVSPNVSGRAAHDRPHPGRWADSRRRGRG